MAYPHRDSQGTLLEIGQQVAYNLSGEVVPGEVVRLNQASIHIICKNRVWKPNGKVSKVRGGRSILVIT